MMYHSSAYDVNFLSFLMIQHIIRYNKTATTSKHQWKKHVNLRREISDYISGNMSINTVWVATSWRVDIGIVHIFS
jgi:hypothetical protein